MLGPILQKVLLMFYPRGGISEVEICLYLWWSVLLLVISLSSDEVFCKISRISDSCFRLYILDWRVCVYSAFNICHIERQDKLNEKTGDGSLSCL